MTKEELTGWAIANGWRTIAGHPSLTKPGSPNDPIVRLVMKITVATLEVRKPAGKWEKVASQSYAGIAAGQEDGPPTGLGFEKVPSISMLMQENRDAMVFSRDCHSKAVMLAGVSCENSSHSRIMRRACLKMMPSCLIRSRARMYLSKSPPRCSRSPTDQTGVTKRPPA